MIGVGRRGIVSPREKIRIAHLQLLPLLSGVQRVTLEEVKRLDRTRFEPFIICMHPGPLTEAAEREGITCLFIPDLVREISPIHDLRAFLQLYRLFRNHNFDIIHTHSSKTGFLGRIAGRFARVPVVMHTVHGYSFPAARSLSERYFYLGLEWLASRACDAMILLKQDDLEIAKCYLGMKESKLHLLPNGIDIESYRPREALDRLSLRHRVFGIGDDTKAVGMVGRLWRQKNPICLVKAAAVVLKERQDVHFFFIGDGEMRSDMETMILDIGISNRVSLLGWRDNVPELLAGLDIFVLPSRWEGLPLAILEALACEVPAVVSDIPGNRDAVINGVDGLLFPDNDENALAHYLLKLLTDPALRASMGQAGRSKIVSRYRIEERVSKISELYEKLINNSGG